MNDDEFIRWFACALGLEGKIETEDELEAAIERSLGFDQFTDEWATQWFADLRREGRAAEYGTAWVVQDDTRAARPGLPLKQTTARPSKR